MLRLIESENHLPNAGAIRADAYQRDYGDVPSEGEYQSSQIRRSLIDICEGALRIHLWGMLGWQDIRQRYRRSLLGPFWLTISMGIMIAALGSLYAGLFRIELSNYLPFLTIGFIIWGLIAAFVTEGCTAFIAAEAAIKQVELPLSVHVYRVLWRNIVIFAHNFLIFVFVAIVFSIFPGWAGFFLIPGLVLLILNGIWIGLLFGLISARFRDVPQVMASVMQVGFFLTPIMWKPELIPDRTLVLDLNPFFYLVEIVRAPLLGSIPPLSVWLATIGITLAGWVVAFYFFQRFRWRIAYWV